MVELREGLEVREELGEQQEITAQQVLEEPDKEPEVAEGLEVIPCVRLQLHG
jgi:hypothetical protein